MRKLFKEEKGITLIALVVTIIVLIILAGVSLNLLFGQNGIIKKAQVAGDEQVLAQIKEDIALKKAEKAIDKYFPEGVNSISTSGNSGLDTAKDLGNDIGGTGRLPTNEEKNTSGMITESGKINPVIEGVDPDLVESINGVQTPEPPSTPNPSVGDEVIIGEKPYIVTEKTSDGKITVIAKEPVPVDTNSYNGNGANSGELTEDEIKEIVQKHGAQIDPNNPENIVLPSGNQVSVADLLPDGGNQVSNPEWELVEDNDNDGKVSLGDLVRPLKQEVASEEFYVIIVKNNIATLLAKHNLNKEANSDGHYMQFVGGGNPGNYGTKFSETGDPYGDSYGCYWDWQNNFVPNMDLNEYTDDNIISTYSLTKENNAILRARDYATIVGGEGTKGKLLVVDDVNNIINGARDDLKNIIMGTYGTIGYMMYWIASTDSSSSPQIAYDNVDTWTDSVPHNRVSMTIPGNGGAFGVRPALEVPVSKMQSSGTSGSSGTQSGTGTTSSIKDPVWQDSYGVTSDYKDSPTSTIEWRLFYADSDNVYLISKDMLEENSGAITVGGKYSDGSKVSSIGKSLNSKYSKYFTASNTSKNVQAVAWLTDTDYWTNKYVPDNLRDDVKAIGGPSIELYEASWNAARTQDTSRTQMSVTVNNKGYDKGGLGARGSIKESYNNKLYRPISAVDNNDTVRQAYLLASPSSLSSDYVRHINCYSGYVNSGDVTLKRKVRPIIIVPRDMVVRVGSGMTAQIKIISKNTGALGAPVNTGDYGRKVINYEAQNLVWRLFYEDSNNIYLISETQDGDYPSWTVQPCIYNYDTLYSPKDSSYVSGESVSQQGKDLMPLLGGQATSSVGTITIGTNSNRTNLLTSSNTNASIWATAYLCDTRANGPWSSYKVDLASWAMGGPTIELFAASYNATHQGGNQISLGIGNYGYTQNTSSNWFLTSENHGIYRLKDSNATWWYLASPNNITNTSNYSDQLQGVYDEYGKFDVLSSIGQLAVRPVVCIQKSTGFTYTLAD